MTVKTFNKKLNRNAQAFYITVIFAAKQRPDGLVG